MAELYHGLRLLNERKIYMADSKKTGKSPASNSTKAKETAKKEDIKNIVPKDVSPNTIVTVRNGFQGRLVYISPRTHEKFVWENFGDEQDMELREIRNAKSSSKAFFAKNWFMFDEDNEWVIPYLGLSRYYKNAIKLEDFDDIFDNTPAKIKSIISKLSSGQKKSVSYRARELVMSRKIDSLKTIEALEEALGTDLIEK